MAATRIDGSTGTRRLSPPGFAVLSVALIVAIVLLWLTLFYPSFTGILGDSELTTYSHQYSVKISAGITTRFQVMCPVPLDSNGDMPAHFLEEMDIRTENTTTDLVETDHGLALQVNGTGSADLRWTGQWSEHHGRYFDSMSMTTLAGPSGGDNMSWVYTNSSNVRLLLDYFFGSLMNRPSGLGSGMDTQLSVDAVSSTQGWSLERVGVERMGLI